MGNNAAEGSGWQYGVENGLGWWRREGELNDAEWGSGAKRSGAF